MAIPTANLVTYLDFLDPACFGIGGTAVNDLSAANEDWTLASNSYTFNPTLGTLSLPTSLYLASNTQNLLGTGNVSFSLSFWNYFDSTKYDTIFYNGNYPTSGLTIVSDNTTGTFAFFYGYLLTQQSNTPVVSMDTWHNIIYTYDHTITTSTIYIDGISVLSFNYSLSQGISTTIYPGVQFNDPYNISDTTIIGLIYVYTRAITNLEVTDLYNEDVNRFFPPPPTVMGGRIFGEGLNG